MNNDVFILKSIRELLDGHIALMNDKYKGSICIDSDGDEYVILSIFQRDCKTIVNVQNERYGFIAFEDIEKYTITDRKI